MWGLNWIDCIIILLLAGAIFEGIQVGLLVQLFVVGGFFGALFFGGWLFPHILPFHDRTLLTLVNANLVLLVASYTAVRGFDLGQRIHGSLMKGKLRSLESGFGVLLSIASVLIIVWLLAAMIGRLPFEGFSNSANDALIVQKLDRHLPAVPAVLAEFNRQVEPNNAPYMFTQSKPQPSVAHQSADFQAANAKAQASIVRITSFGCGGIAAGSGFVAGPDLVATNAHVIAGVKRPIVKYNNRSYEGVPVVFSPNLDFAVLRVKGLNAQPLTVAKQAIKVGTTVAVLGFPKGNYASVPGIVRNNLTIFGRNIYDVGVFGRNIYEVQTHVDQGSSGGPIVTSDGQVAGMMFAKYNSVDDYGYALTSPSLQTALQQAEKSHRRISTGICMAD